MTESLNREAFEKWHSATFEETPVWNQTRNLYEDFAHHMAWKGWQAAWEAGRVDYIADVAVQEITQPSEIPGKIIVSEDDGVVSIHYPGKNIVIVIDEDGEVTLSNKKNGFYANSAKALKPTERECSEILAVNEERLINLCGLLADLVEGGRPYIASMAALLRPYLSQSKREICRVSAKPLVWDLSGETHVIADQEISEINILGSHSGKAARYGIRRDVHTGTWQVCFWCGNIGMWSAYRLATIDEAKKAAQEHYDSVVRENSNSIEDGKTDA